MTSIVLTRFGIKFTLSCIEFILAVFIPHSLISEQLVLPLADISLQIFKATHLNIFVSIFW